MKLRLVSLKERLLIYCSDGTVLDVDDSLLRKLFIGFQNPTAFKKGNEKWNSLSDDISKAPGHTLAYVNDLNELCIVDANPFYSLVSSVGNKEYITVKEYAQLHNKGVAIIKRLCAENRLAGAVNKSGCWFIPINAPYPKDGRRKD